MILLLEAQVEGLVKLESLVFLASASGDRALRRFFSKLLDEETRRYEQLIATALQQVALLRERRSALISAAVTGQIDVRGLATEEEP